MLAEAVFKRWPTEEELEMPDILWPSVIEGILKTQVKLQCKE